MESSSDLENLRLKIDEIDDKIINFLIRRFKTVFKIGEYKKEHGKAIFQASREEFIMGKVRKEAIKSEINPEALIKVYETILEKSRDFQEKMRGNQQ